MSVFLCRSHRLSIVSERTLPSRWNLGKNVGCLWTLYERAFIPCNGSVLQELDRAQNTKNHNRKYAYFPSRSLDTTDPIGRLLSITVGHILPLQGILALERGTKWKGLLHAIPKNFKDIQILCQALRWLAVIFAFFNLVLFAFLDLVLLPFQI